MILSWEIVEKALYSEACHFALGLLVALGVYYLISTTSTVFSSPLTFSSPRNIRPTSYIVWGGWLCLSLALGVLFDRYGVDTVHARTVAEHALALFDHLLPFHDLPPERRALLETAALWSRLAQWWSGRP